VLWAIVGVQPEAPVTAHNLLCIRRQKRPFSLLGARTVRLAFASSGIRFKPHIDPDIRHDMRPATPALHESHLVIEYVGSFIERLKERRPAMRRESLIWLDGDQSTRP
jgi:hypothetical protein